MDKPTIVLDNGAYTAKVGSAADEKPSCVPNCIMKVKSERRRQYVGNEINQCRDLSGLFYKLAFQRGYLLNWDVEKVVWDHMFSKDGTGLTLEDTNIIITEPQMNFCSLQENLIEILFEEYQCAGVHKTTAAELAAYHYAIDHKQLEKIARHCIIVDAGYSFTHVVPIVGGERVVSAIRRIDMGGKALTNYLKEIISYRHVNVMDESYVVNQIKEDCCFVAEDFKAAMRVYSEPKKQSAIAVDYVLPDFMNMSRGYVVDPKNPRPAGTDQQVVRLCGERFSVPELLFNPSDVGINQVGIHGAIVDAAEHCPEKIRPFLFDNIVVVGGSTQFPGFLQRLRKDLRPLINDFSKLAINKPEDPITYAWHGGKELAKSESFDKEIFTRKEYNENGYSPR